MKRLLLFVGLLTGFGATAQNCSDLFISEYVEGWSNNKALEIYNPTNASIDLSQYYVARFSNGANASSEGAAIQLTGTIDAYGTHVAVLDKRDENGAGQEAPVWDSLQIKADAFYCPEYTVSNAFYFNGNDALVLGKGTAADPNNGQVVDIFGKIGEDPGDSWTSAFPYNNGGGAELTKDHSLIRKATIQKGVTDFNISFFNALEEYDSIPAVTPRLDEMGDPVLTTSGDPVVDGNWSSLGEHSCDCNTNSVEELTSLSLAVYPNPSTNGVVYLKSTIEITGLTIVNGLGQKVLSLNNVGKFQKVQLPSKTGVYFFQIVSNTGAVITKRVILK